jgi:hypothetical protein
MNNSAGRKLRSQSGASLVLAILVFLVCTLVGSTILAAASSSGGTLINTWQEDQQVYLLKSAAAMFTPGFTGKNYVLKEQTKDSSGNPVIPSSCTVDTLYVAMCAKTYVASSASQTLNFAVGNTGSVTVNSVKAVITMDEYYNVNADFTTEGSSRTVSVYIPAATLSSSSVTARAESVTWGDPITTVK